MKFKIRFLSWHRLDLRIRLLVSAFSVFTAVFFLYSGNARADDDHTMSRMDQTLIDTLRDAGFTGEAETTFRNKLGRPIDQKRAELGRMLWFDIIGGLNNDNTCGGCHSPTNGFGDTQPIAIGMKTSPTSPHFG